ncbi:MAG: ABC-ATPase domain-containing protein [Firmicutes bacterium]|nr:ABC-ATPase domain-containing protein [Bacillota bacterium]
MESLSQFTRLLRALDGKPYQGYRDLTGAFTLGPYELYVDHVQSDPFAPPTRVRLRVHADLLRLDATAIASHERRVASEDFLTRRLGFALESLGKQRRGSGRSGVILIDTPSQTVLPRSSVEITPDYLEARIAVGLPADGRRIRAKDAEAMFLEDLPYLLHTAWSRASFPFSQLERHVALYVDQCFIRRSLKERGLIAFIGDGSVLARKSGISELPMDASVAQAFISPDSLRVTFTCPSGLAVTGMGVAAGVTLIAGGGFHGKSTLLQAIVGGVYNHVAADGREWCISDETAVKVRAEDGRRVSRVDISGFINHLPRGRSTTSFSTQDASGSTSQAASIVEALELGATVLLIDEDTSAANFMLRDARMQRLVSREHEPITPFIDRVRELYNRFGVSSVLVIGGAGDYLDVADVVLLLDEYVPTDATERALEVTRELPAARVPEALTPLMPARPRAPQPLAIGARLARLEAKSRTVLQYGDEFVDLSALEQLSDESQTRAVAALLRYGLLHTVDGEKPLGEVVHELIAHVHKDGFVSISPVAGCSGFYALPRAIEIGLAWNRVRGLAIR